MYTIKNHWGYTAEELLNSGNAARADWSRNFMPFWKPHQATNRPYWDNRD